MDACQGMSSIFFKTLPDFENETLSDSESDVSDSEIEYFQNNVENNVFVLQYADSAITENKELMFEFTRKNAFAFRFASETLRSDENLAWIALSKNIHLLPYVHQNLFNDQAFLLKVIALKPDALHYIKRDREDLLKDKDFIFKVLEVTVEVLHYVDETFLSDRDFALKVVELKKKTAFFFRDFHEDKEFMLKAITLDADAYCLCVVLGFDEGFKEEVLRLNPEAKYYMPQSADSIQQLAS